MEETRDNADLLSMRTGSLRPSSESADPTEMKDLRTRVHLLTEENQVLFEQITLLRSHYDHYNDQLTSKLTEADAKSQAFDLLQQEFSFVSRDRDELLV